MKRNGESGTIGRRLFAAGFALLLAAPAVAAERRGYVDGSVFVDLGGDEDVTIEINLPGALIAAVAKADPELSELVGGIRSIRAVVLELRDEAQRVRGLETVRAVERSLVGEGWERLARVRESGSEIKILVLNDEDTVQGLVVMVLDRDSGELVFANVDGLLDLGRISALGEQFSVPGLSKIE